MVMSLMQPLLYVYLHKCYKLLSTALYKQGTSSQHMFVVRAMVTITGESATFITQPDDHQRDISNVWLKF